MTDIAQQRTFYPTSKYFSDRLEIKFTSYYHSKIYDKDYKKLIIPDFINKKYVEITIDYWNSGYGTICINNITKIAEENKLTIQSIEDTIKRNLIANMQAPPPRSVYEEDIKPMLYILAFGFGCAAFIGLMIKLNVQF